MCLVIDCSTAGVLPEKMLEKIKAIQSKIHVRGMVAWSPLHLQRCTDSTMELLILCLTVHLEVMSVAHLISRDGRTFL